MEDDPRDPNGDPGFDREPRRSKNMVGFFLLISLLMLALVLFGTKGAFVSVNNERIQLGEFRRKIEAGEVKTVTFEGDKVYGELAPGDKAANYSLRVPKDYWTNHEVDWQVEEKVSETDPQTGQERQVTKAVQRKGTFLDYVISRVGAENVNYESADGSFGQILLATLPWIVLFALIYFFVIRQMRASSGAGGVLSFGRSRARLAGKDKTNVTLADVAGMDEAKAEVNEIIEFLKDPSRFQRIGGRIPRGVLLIGSPGTGKTLLAKAIAGEASVPFFSISGSDFVEMFVGVGASRVRDLFKQAKEKAPCIVFLDEIDAVGRRRGAGLGGGHDEREQTLNAILVEMDGFDTEEGIIVIAATNRPDVLDPALSRPGRFDRQITVDMPDVRGREAILRVHARRIKLDASVDLSVLARGTPGFSGAELEAVLNEAALLAVIRGKRAVEMADCEDSRDKVRWGREKRSRVVEEEDRRVTAYHESGHALIPYLIPELDPMHKVTIIPRGMAGGMTMFLPEREEMHLTRSKCLAWIKVLYAGRLAEEIFCDDISSGASNDIERATELIRRMVCLWGMSDDLGPLKYEDDDEHVFLGREISRSRGHSESTYQKIDVEILRIASDCFEATRQLLLDNREKIERMTVALLQLETLDADDVAIIIRGGDVDEVVATREARTRKGRGRPAHPPGPSPETAQGTEVQPESDGDGGLEAQGEPAY